MNLKDLTKKIFIAFMIIQPLLDMYMCLFDKKIQIVGVSLATIVRFATVFVMTILIMIHAKKNKSTKCLIIYAVLVGIYMVCHHLNAVSFNINMPTAEYNMVGEILYILRMCVPIAMIYIIYWIKPNYKDIKRIVIGVSLIISLTMLVTDVFKIAYRSYSLENVKVSHSIFSWFTELDKHEWVGLTNRGFFASGNQLSAVTIILAPIVTYIALKEKKIQYWGVVFLHVLSMIFLTTRVAIIGGIVSVIAVAGFWLLEKIVHKELDCKNLFNKTCISFIVVTILCTVVCFNSPFKRRIETNSLKYEIAEAKENAKIDRAKLPDGISEEVLRVEKRLSKSGTPIYLYWSVYPFFEDPEFWSDLLQLPLEQRSGNRTLRNLLMNRILERDNKISNYVFGISFTRASSFIWPERDIFTHVDCIGYVGLILFISPYLLVFVYGCYKVLRKLKDNFYVGKNIYLFALALGIIAGIASGHVMNEMFPFLFLSMVTGLALNVALGDNPEIYKKENTLRKYFEKIYTKSKADFYNEVEQSLINKDKKFIITANPETIMVAEKNEEFKKILLSKSTTIIPDGIGIIKGAKVLGYPQREVMTGVDLVEKLFELCDKDHKSVFLFGAKPEVIEKIQTVLPEKYPNMKILGTENGYVDDRQAVFERIKKLKPDVVLVALGIPHQEIIINRNIDDFETGIFVGIGGSFDVLSGMKKRAPKIFRRFNLEWLYRICREPKRIKRFFECNIRYLFKLSDEK